MGIFRPRSSKALVLKQELNHLVMAWGGPAGKGVHKSFGQGPNPATTLTERASRASRDLVHARFTGEKGSGK
jgi:hypothetical protein